VCTGSVFNDVYACRPGMSVYETLSTQECECVCACMTWCACAVMAVHTQPPVCPFVHVPSTPKHDFRDKAFLSVSRCIREGRAAGPGPESEMHFSGNQEPWRSQVTSSGRIGGENRCHREEAY